MKRGQRAAVLALLNREMLRCGSWCGETHIQKATFFLQELTGADLGFDFVIYRHGPFSFDLRDELSSMQADELVSLQLRQPGYGPTFVPTQFSEDFLERFPKTRSRYFERIRFVAEELGQKNVAELEKLATAFYILRRSDNRNTDGMVDELTQLKPHIPHEAAYQAFQDVHALIERSQPVVPF